MVFFLLFVCLFFGVFLFSFWGFLVFCLFVFVVDVVACLFCFFLVILEISQYKKEAHQLLCIWEEASASGKFQCGILG